MDLMNDLVIIFHNSTDPEIVIVGQHTWIHEKIIGNKNPDNLMSVFSKTFSGRCNKVTQKRVRELIGQYSGVTVAQQ